MYVTYNSVVSTSIAAEGTKARTKSHDGLTVYLFFDHVGEVCDFALNPYRESPRGVQQAIARHPWVLVTMLYDLNPDMSVFLSRTVT